MTFLFDTNLLIALFDPMHVHHAAAFDWIERRTVRKWATCPITENGFIRIVSHPAYPSASVTAAVARGMLKEAVSSFPGHEFWADSVSVCDDQVFNVDYISSHKRVTDAYLLSIAVAHGGRLATFDRKIDHRAVRKATPESLELIVEE